MIVRLSAIARKKLEISVRYASMESVKAHIDLVRPHLVAMLCGTGTEAKDTSFVDC